MHDAETVSRALHDHRLLITGGSAGVGRARARAFLLDTVMTAGRTGLTFSPQQVEREVLDRLAAERHKIMIGAGEAVTRLHRLLLGAGEHGIRRR